MRAVKYEIIVIEKNEFYYSPQWLRGEGWAVDKDNIRYSIGFVYNQWWYEKLGFSGYRVYCEREFIEKNFKPITPLQEVRYSGERK